MTHDDPEKAVHQIRTAMMMLKSANEYLPNAYTDRTGELHDDLDDLADDVLATEIYEDEEE